MAGSPHPLPPGSFFKCTTYCPTPTAQREILALPITPFPPPLPSPPLFSTKDRLGHNALGSYRMTGKEPWLRSVWTSPLLNMEHGLVCCALHKVGSTALRRFFLRLEGDSFWKLPYDPQGWVHAVDISKRSAMHGSLLRHLQHNLTEVHELACLQLDRTG